MNILPEEVNKYLSKYSLEGWEIEWNQAQVTTVVVIPAIKEHKNLLLLLSSLEQLDKKHISTTLFLFVINNTVISPQEVKEENRLTIDYLRQLMLQKRNGNNLNIGLIDASKEGKELNEKDGGVGLARKIGMDAALKIFNYTSEYPKLLICLDADCTVSKNYLTGINEHFYLTKSEAASIYFEHSPEPLSDAIINYEIFLRYYVHGLRFANSYYAFHTIGSSMACTYNSYIKVEGMNKKKAAEDFYFLEKLAKTTSISKINNVTVFPSQRGSWRVPFGTGQRINRFHSQSQDEYLLYNPEIFIILKEWLILLDNITSTSPETILELSREIHPGLAEFLKKNSFISSWKNILHTSRSTEQINRQKHKWFDGFKTLKLVHYLRDNGFPNQNMFRALNQIFELTGIQIDFKSDEKIPPYNIRLSYLKMLRELDRL